MAEHLISVSIIQRIGQSLQKVGCASICQERDLVDENLAVDEILNADSIQ